MSEEPLQSTLQLQLQEARRALQVHLCTGGLDVIRKEAWPFYRTSSGVRLWWELEEPKGPKGTVLGFSGDTTPCRMAGAGIQPRVG